MSVSVGNGSGIGTSITSVDPIVDAVWPWDSDDEGEESSAIDRISQA